MNASVQSYYSQDIDPRGFQTAGSYWSVGGAAPNESAVVPDSSMIAYTAGYGSPPMGSYVPPGGGLAYKSSAQAPGTDWSAYAGPGSGVGVPPVLAVAGTLLALGLLFG